METERAQAASRSSYLVAAALLLIFALIYVPDIGHGFIKDDFVWILQGQLQDASAIQRILVSHTGFYRPVVTLSFGIDYQLYGTNSFGYGLTNLALAIATAIALARLALALGLSATAAVTSAAIWAFNFHGINMALLWLSGRTSLLASLWAVLAATALVRRRPALLAIFSFLAFMSKEEAVPLVGILCAWAALDRYRETRSIPTAVRDALRQCVPIAIALVVYLVLRANSGAFTPATAPTFYQFSFAPDHLARNILEYADRSSTFAAIALLAALIYTRRATALRPTDSAVIVKGLLWLLGGFVVTVALPIRSSLYAVFPSIGAALIAGSCSHSLFAALPISRQRRLVACTLAVLLLLVPVYRSRNVRWVELADLTAGVVRVLNTATSDVPLPALVVLVDDRTTRLSFANAFGTMFPEASMVLFRGAYHLWIEPLPADLGEADVQKPPYPEALRIRLGADGQLHFGPTSLESQNRPR